MTPTATRMRLQLEDRKLWFANKWFFLWHHIGGQETVTIDLFNGQQAYYAGLGFDGSARDIYWEAIARGVRNEVVDQFSWLEQECLNYKLPTALKAMDEGTGQIVSFARSIRRQAIAKDRILRGNGLEFPAENDAGYWDGSSDEEIVAQCNAIKATLIERLEPVAVERPTKLVFTEVEIAERQVLFALLVENHVNPSALRSLEEFRHIYQIDVPDAWLASTISPWVSRGWIKVFRTLSEGDSVLLKPEHYLDALKVIMEWLGATSLKIDAEARQITSDIGEPASVTMRSGWLWRETDPLVREGSTAASNRSIRLDHSDPALLQIKSRLDEVVEQVRGDNALEDREDILASLHHARSLLARAEISLLQIKVGLTMALDDAISLTTKSMHVVAIEAIRAAVVEWIRRGFHF